MTSPLPASFMSSIIENEMNVTKRNGVLETVSFDKILQRMKRQGKEDNIKVNYTALAMKVIDQLYDGISTIKIDELSAEQCASMASVHYDYNTLAGRIIVSSHQKNTEQSFSQVMSELYNFIDKNGKPAKIVSDELMDVVSKNFSYLDDLCEYNRDFLIDYFGFKTLDRAYLMKIHGKTVERPQHMWLRVAIGIHGHDLVNVKETYDLMSQKYFTHATPTLFNAGTPQPQLSSCFLLAMETDSIDGIFNTLKDCALISKYAGGIGLHIHNVRATGSHIRGTNGSSNGIVPMLRVFNNTAKYVDQCIKPETIIFTTHGPKEIQNCTAGETSIFNLLGETEVIENVLEHQYDGDILEIQTNFTSSILSITPQHPIFILRNNEQTWIDAGEVSNGDSIIYSIPIYEKDISNITEDDCRIYGYIIKHGEIDKNTGNYTIQIELLDENNIEVIKKYLEIHLVQYEMDNKFIIWKPELHIPFRYSDVYDESNKKHIHSRWLHLPTDKLKGLYSIVNNYNYNNYSLFNRNIQSQIAYISLRLAKSILPYGTEYVNDEKTMISTKITSIVNSKYTGILYDLQMSKQHDYLLENGLVHNGGGRRNGSFAIYLEPWHADIEAFLQMRKNHGDEEMKARDLFYALWIPDLFMERVKANGQWTLMCPDECPGLADVCGEEFKTLYESYEQSGKGRVQVPARELWFKVLDAQMETGTPYLCYKDAANLKSNQKNVGTIKSSNLCVAPETVILTDKGHIEIQSLKDQTVNVWNGKEFSEVTVQKTGEDQELIDVYTDDGLKLSCTPYHKFFIQNDYSNSSIEKVEAKDLKPNDKIIKCDYPIIDGSENMLYPYTHGFFCGDGTYETNFDEPERPCEFNAIKGQHFCKKHLGHDCNVIYLLNDIEYIIDNENLCKQITYGKKPVTYLYEDRIKLLDFIDKRSHVVNEKSKRIDVVLPLDLNKKFDIPSNFCSIKDKLDWFAGYCDANGSISRNGDDNEQLQVSSKNKEFLENVKLLLQTCGINPKIKLRQIRNESYLPYGKDSDKFFDVKSIYTLLITSCDLYNLYKLGFNTKRLIISGNKPLIDDEQFIKILKVENNNRIDDTYCFSEPKRHMGIFNGIITGQCSEIIEYSDENETAVCNLASIGLPSFVTSEKVFDYEKLHEVAKVITKNLNKIIEINYYPTEKTRRSNMRHRPIGIGIQGLADVFLLLGYAFLSDEAREINRYIFETIYHGALEASCELAEQLGPYETFQGSPASKGILQFDMWNVQPSARYDWTFIKNEIKYKGLRNSLLLAPMPTASTSQILGFNECIEPITSNIYSRRTIAGEFIQVNRYLIEELISLGLWNEKVKNNIIANHGSIQQLEFIPQEVKEKYKTVWEIPMRGLIDMAADRGAFICQSQSLNLWLEDPNYNTLTAMHFYAWQKGLKTGIYYLRRRGKHQAQQFTIEPEKTQHTTTYEEEICEMCSS